MSHARLSPSAAKRWMSCPGSIREEDKYRSKDAKPGAAAVDGTHTHTLVEKCLLVGGDFTDASVLVKQELEDDDGKFIVDPSRADRANVMIDYVRSVKNSVENAIVYTERKVSPERFIGRDDMNGTADCIIIDAAGKYIEIVDYKDGAVHVPVEKNPQLMIYLISAIAGSNYELDSFDTLKMTIVQPKSAFQGKDPIRTTEIDGFALNVFIDELKKAAKTTDAKDAPLIPGEEQCRWCAHKGSCKPLADKTMDEMDVSFDDLTQQAADKDPNELTDEEMTKILKAGPLIKKFVEGVEAEAQRRIEEGQTVPGYKLVKGNGRNKWNKDEVDIAGVLNKMGIPKKDCYTQKVLSPSQVQKFKWENTKGEQKQLTKRQKERLIVDYISKSEGKLTLVPESDSREALNFNVSDMFESVEDEVPNWLK